MKKVSLIIAMEKEAASLIESLKLSPVPESAHPLPMKYYVGESGGLSVSLTVHGKDRQHHVDSVGTQAAAIATLTTIQRFSPDIIINAGTAGGFQKRGSKIADIYLSSGPIRFYDRRIPLPGYIDYGIGSYPSWNTDELSKALGIKQGHIVTGDSLSLTAEDNAFMKTHKAHVKEMEAASVAWIASLHRIPMFAVKVITDLVDIDQPLKKQFSKNFNQAKAAITETIPKIIDFLAKN